jgi:hypothetical protein
MRWLLLIVAAACAAVVPSVGAAATSSRCGATVLKDWSDGKLDRTYPVRCYQDALNRMPEDMRSYTTAPDDIQRALLARLRTGRHHVGSSPQAGARKAAPSRTTAQAERAARHDPTREALSAAGLDAAGSARGIPLPLLFLAAIGLVLVAAGSGSFAIRRLRARADT